MEENTLKIKLKTKINKLKYIKKKEHSEKMVLCKPWKKASEKSKPDNILILDFQPPEL